ncbi:MAG: PKD domain-containing protein [Deltaproteobacteria bacterium]|nr:PKD domain-containing protein [Deltaproteobacteria bacterium]
MTERRRRRWVDISLVALLAGACSSGGEAPEAGPDASRDPSQTPSRLEFVPELYVEPEARPEDGPPPLRVRFRANVEDATGVVECEWDFGDGSPKAKETNPTHVYERVGDYEILVVCRDEIGTAGEGETDVFVELDED